MNQTNYDSAHWRRRAEEAQRSAAEATDANVKSVLAEIARAYERLAEITRKAEK